MARQQENDMAPLNDPEFEESNISGLRAYLQSRFHRSTSRRFTLFCLIPTEIPGMHNLKRDFNTANRTSNIIIYFMVPSSNTSIRIFQDYFDNQEVKRTYNCYYQELQRPPQCKNIAEWVALLTVTFILDTRYQLGRRAVNGAKFYFSFNMNNSSLGVKSITSTWRTYSKRILLENRYVGGKVFCVPGCHEACPHRGKVGHVNFSRFKPYIINPQLAIQKKFNPERYMFHLATHDIMDNCILRPLLILDDDISFAAIVLRLHRSIKRVRKNVYMVAVKTNTSISLYVGSTINDEVPRLCHWRVPVNGGHPHSSLAKTIRHNSDVYLVYRGNFNEFEANMREALFIEILKYRQRDYRFEMDTNRLTNVRSEYTAALSLSPKDHIDAAVFLSSNIPVLALTPNLLRTNAAWSFTGNYHPITRVVVPRNFMNYVYARYPPPPVVDLMSDSE